MFCARLAQACVTFDETRDFEMLSKIRECRVDLALSAEDTIEHIQGLSPTLYRLLIKYTPEGRLITEDRKKFLADQFRVRMAKFRKVSGHAQS